MRPLLLAVATLSLAVPAAAQQSGNSNDPDRVVQGGKLPAGWSARVDRDQPLDRVKFVPMGTGFHATMGPAAVFYNPEWKKSGDYRVSASLTQTKAPTHPEAYGIVLGGNGLEGADQAYSYFLVRGTGQYFIATRKGGTVTKVVDWTSHDAVKKQDEAGKQTNVLGAEVRGADVIFTVNGTEVARRPKGEVLTEGLFGFRINHNLDVHLDQIQH